MTRKDPPRPGYGTPFAWHPDADKDKTILPPTMLLPPGKQSSKTFRFIKCNYGCGRMVYKNELTGKWTENSGEVHTRQRCTNIKTAYRRAA